MRYVRLYRPGGQQVQTGRFYGLSGLEPRLGYYDRGVGCEIDPQGHLVGARAPAEVLRRPGLRQYGDGWTIEGDGFYVGGVKKGTLSAGEKCVVRFGDKWLIFPDRMAYDRVKNTFAGFTAPADMRQAVVFGNRVFGIVGGLLRASALGDEGDWESYQNPDGSPRESGSYRVAVAGGSFTAITAFLNHVTVFTDEAIYELYGNRPSNFTLTQCATLGVTGPGQAGCFDKTLWFFARQSLYSYRGGAVRDELAALGITFADMQLCCTQRGAYFLADGGVYRFDGALVQLGAGDYTALTTFGGTVYATAADGACYALERGARQGFCVQLRGGLGGGNLQQYELLYRGSIAAYQNGRLLGKKQSRELDRMRCYVQLGGRQPRPLQLRLGPDSALCGLRYSLYGGDDR